MIEGDFPEVRRISTDSLAHWLGDTALDLPRLIDVRAEEEYRISHIKGAIRISPDAEVFPELQGIDSAAPIVLYCSVGYRSARLAELLEREGFSNVMNLQGSIFQWANEGRPLYQNGELVEKVHEYDRVWGVLLDGEYWRE